jgi:hypothetical protein
MRIDVVGRKQTMRRVSKHDYAQKLLYSLDMFHTILDLV